MTYDDIISKLYELADKDKVAFKEKKFGIQTTNTLGIYHKDLKELAKEINRDKTIDQSALGVLLFESEIYEARLLCSKVFKHKDLSEDLMEKWIKVFDTWEICDSFCMGLFAKTDFAIPKIKEWSSREREFEKRSAFATMAAYCMADKKAMNEVYENFFPIIKKEVTDERLYVKKAVNWALRSIGKRNIDLKESAILIAEEIEQIDNKAAKWIAKDALRELRKDDVRMSDYPRDVYRKSAE